MTTFEITSLKALMHQLLTGDTFDGFLLEEAVVRTALTYTVDGRIHPEFYPPEERGEDCIPYEFQPWRDVKGLFFDLIKGKHTPLAFKFVLLCKPEAALSLLSDRGCGAEDASRIRWLVLTIQFDGSRARITTGTSHTTFAMNREPEAAWDGFLASYLTEKGISFETP